MHIILIGHRGAGKTTLAALIAPALGSAFIDLDLEIEQRYGRSAADFVRDDEAGFRDAEVLTLTNLVRTHPASVIATGGGISSVPAGALVIWVDRDGWEQVAFAHRARLRPELPFEKEVEWMRWDRESRYARMAHLRLRLERDLPAEAAAERALRLIGWMRQVRGERSLASTWMLVPSLADLARCRADAALFGLAGIEVRSDLLPATVPVQRDPMSAADAPPVRVLASLRTPDPTFLTRHADAAMYDVDIRFIDGSAVERLPLDALEPRPLLVSSHPKDVWQEDFDALIAAADRLGAYFPAWRDKIALKYAPVVKSWMELRVAHEFCRVHARRGGRVSFLPQGRSWHWVRVMRMRNGMQQNYVRPGCATEGTLPPPLEIFVPTAVGPAPERWCGLIGRPVEYSAGDVWHRARSLSADGGRTGYLKIPLSPEEREQGVYFLMKLGVNGLSVTSPLKDKLFPSTFITRGSDIETGNTLTLRNGGWSLTDTDEEGMRASLRHLASRGIAPGSVAVFGRGGVLAAIERACAAEGWGPVATYSAREGWGELPPNPVQLIVDTSSSAAARLGAPVSDAWLDLAYVGCPAPPHDVRVYMTGRIFYEAQAEAQWRHWGLVPD